MASARASTRPRLVSRTRPIFPRTASPTVGNTCSIMPSMLPEHVFAVNHVHNIELVFDSGQPRC
jgi:hypothetical protein